MGRWDYVEIDKLNKKWICLIIKTFSMVFDYILFHANSSYSDKLVRLLSGEDDLDSS